MTEPNLEQELERLLNATRAGTEPDANARARVRAGLAASLASAGALKAGITTRVGLGAKLWLLSAFAIAVLVGVSLLGQPENSAPAPAPARASAAASLAASPPDARPASTIVAVPSALAAVSTPAAANAPRPAASQPRVAAKAEEPADELALVSAMQLALRSGNASQALALANEHARRFPGGALVQEREGARAIAHCQLATPASRSAILASFEQRYAGSPYAARVKDACTR